MDFNFSDVSNIQNIYSLIAVLIVAITYAISIITQHRSRKKVTKQNTAQTNEIKDAIVSLTNKIGILIDKETNNVNQASAEAIFETILSNSMNKIKSEISRIFYHNHREDQRRKCIIKDNLNTLTSSVYNDDHNTLSKFYYKEKPLSNFLDCLDSEGFYKNLLHMVFSVSDNKQDLEDTLYYIETSFESFIIRSKQYLINI